MSVQSAIKRKTAPEIRSRKNGEPIVMLTSYHAHTAALVDRHCDVILVGDSLGNVMHGFETTVPVTLDMMILQGRAVMRGSQRALVVVDMPFGSYEASKEQAFHSAARILKETRCGAVKLEGGARMAETIAFLVERGIPVMGHIGLTPQSINTLGSFRAQGRDEAGREPIENDARAVAQSGAFSVVIEAVAEPLAPQDHASDRHSYHRHRRKRSLRWSGSGSGRYARPISPRPQIRSPLWQSRPDDRGRDRELRRRRALAGFSGAGARLRHEGQGAEGGNRAWRCKWITAERDLLTS